MTVETLYNKLGLSARMPCTDSRNVPEGSVFFALKGDAFDGNLFAQQALEQGAAFAVVDDASIAEDDRYVVVGDVLETFQELASYHRSRFSVPVIAIGGSNGKTTTKELVRTVLESKYKTVSTRGNLNNHVGVPITLFRLNGDTEIAVIEIGANHPHEHELLCRMVSPTHVLVTNNGKDHLEGFGSLEGVRRANAEIYDFARASGAHAFVIGTHEDLVRDSEDLSRTVYGVDAESGFFATVSFGGERIESQLVGAFNGENIAAALAIGTFFSVPLADMKQAIASYAPAMLRSQVVRSVGATWILDCYNANPSSMAAGLSSFAGSVPSPRSVILGDMFELGDHSAAEHAAMLEYALSLSFDRVIFVGRAFADAGRGRHGAVFFESSEGAKEYAAGQDWAGHSVFVKGSRGMKLETLLPFDISNP